MAKKTMPQALAKGVLSEKEALVYYAILELGGASPSLVAEYTKLRRTTVYKILLDLSVKGLVNEIEKKNKLYYQAENPKKLARYAKSKINLVQQEVEQTLELIPHLEGIYSSLDKPKVLYFEGEEEVINMYEDHLNVSEPYEMVGFVNGESLKSFLPPTFYKKYIETKAKLGITTRGILPDTPSNRSFTSEAYKGVDKKYQPKIRFAPTSLYNFQAEITIYGQDRVSIAKHQGKNVIGIIIEDQQLHNAMKMIFELSWLGAENFNLKKS